MRGRTRDDPAMVRLAVRWVLLAMAFAVLALVVPDVHVSGGIIGLLATAAWFAVVNVCIGPVLQRVSLPLTTRTFGLFSLVVNAALLLLTAFLTDYLDVGGVLPALAGALLLTVLNALARWAVPMRSGA